MLERLHPLPAPANNGDNRFDPEPSAAVITQDQVPPPPIMTVPVVVQGPTTVQQLPRVSGGSRTVVVGTTPVRVQTADPRRAEVSVYAWDNDWTYGESQAEATGVYAAKWPKGLNKSIKHTGELWVASTTGTTALTVDVDNWAG